MPKKELNKCRLKNEKTPKKKLSKKKSRFYAFGYLIGEY
jgi:hypothetical protein